MSIDLRATYRLQLHAGFTLDDAAALVDYLKALGISHIYSSPILQAAAGSQHGYDVVDPQQVNRDLGGSEAFARLSYALMQAEMGLVLDIVPNHMAVGRDNPWWWDVLENGPSSPYAAYFDVEWDPPEARHSNAVLLPVLGDHYGRVLEAGEIKLAFDGLRFEVQYHEHAFPLDPRTLGIILARAALCDSYDELSFLAQAFAGLPVATASDRSNARRRSQFGVVLYRWLGRLVREKPEIDQAVRTAVEEINQDYDLLDALLQEQNYRLAFWRITARELGYRRFFNINSLIGMRTDDQAVYDEAHVLLFGWIKAGLVDGLRIDHPDGLLDPEGYFQRLRQDAPQAWIVIEKILEPGERLPQDWPVNGTTGYDFMARLNGLFVARTAEAQLTDFYTQFTAQSSDWEALVRRKKLYAANELLGSDLNHLTAMLVAITECRRRYRDYTRTELRDAVAELAADLPVYRTFVRAASGQVHPDDYLHLTQALETAKAMRPDLDPLLFDFLYDLLTLKYDGSAEGEWVMRFQQFSGPLMAKGVEDTAFYNYYRLVSLNEVGSSPGQFGLALDEFHRACQETQARWGRSMLSSSTHDTKRSEDVRARLNVLSQIPQVWQQTVLAWAEHNLRYKTGDAPDRNDEYLLYQTLVGAWPIDVERVTAYMQKALRESRRHSSWTTPDEAYESATHDFIRAILADDGFVAQLQAFAARLTPPGWINSLAQTLIKLTSPGIPDIYQGSEVWSFSLVDPDNRRPVDFARRQALLQALDGLTPADILGRAAEGLPKLWLVRQALHLRQERPQAFNAAAAYQPLPLMLPAGVEDDLAIAYLRADEVLVVAPLRVGLLALDETPAALDDLAAHPALQAQWASISLALPAGQWRNLLSGESHAGGAPLTLARLFQRFPAALLVKE